VPAQPLDSVSLCHFPIRSVGQYASKIAVGYLQYSAMARWSREEGFHYIEPFRLLAGGIGQLASSMATSSRRYSMYGSGILEGEPMDAPLRYAGGELSLTRPREAPLASVLQCAEALAGDLADRTRRYEAVEEALRAATLELADAAPLQRIAALRATAAHAVEAQQDLEEKLAQALLERSATAAEVERLAAGKAAVETTLAALAADKAALEARLAAVAGACTALEERHCALQAELASLRETAADQADQLASRTVKLVQRVHGFVARAGLPPGALADQVYRLLRID
jgi:hypothetical protein